MTKYLKFITCQSVLALIITVSLVSCSGSGQGNTKPTAGIVKEPFGLINDQPVELYTLTNHNGMVVKIITYGGIITELHVPDRDGQMGDVVLGFDNLHGYISPEYMRNNPNFGAIIGRYGNRIADGKFTIDGIEYTLATNDGKNHLHGGIIGFNRVVWVANPIENANGNALVLTYLSKDMEEGYPGNLQVTVTYTLTNENELKIDYHAIADKATPCNLTNHSYFNLSAGTQPTIVNHELAIFADKYTEVGRDLIPTGNLLDVVNTPMDFTTPYSVGERIDTDFDQLRFGGGYDHNWVIRNSNGLLVAAATVYEPESGRFMEVHTTEPGIQFYSGNFLDGSLTGKNDTQYLRRGGLCLETQHFPDSPNQPTFPSTILQAGETYQTQTIYRFSVK